VIDPSARSVWALAVSVALLSGTVLSTVLPIVAPAAVAAQASPLSGGNGTIFFATYGDQIFVIDENTFEVVDRIETQAGIPGDLVLSADRERFYVTDATAERIEVIDIATRESTGWFTLSEGNTKFRIRGGVEVHPDESYAILIGKTTTKHRDRFEIGETVMVRVDLETESVMDTIPWPGGDQREGANLQFSPDGSLLYFYAEDVIVLETEGFTEVDRWEISRPLEDGLGRTGIGFGRSLYEEPGFFTGMFRVTDPVQNRRMFGIARVDLAGKEVDFYTLGPSQSFRSFALAPDRKKAYSLLSEVGRYEFWTFDLENRRVESRQEFAGRPRMGIEVSTNGELLYIMVAGRTIDIYDAESYEYLRTVELDGDMTSFVLLPPSQ